MITKFACHKFFQHPLFTTIALAFVIEYPIIGQETDSQNDMRSSHKLNVPSSSLGLGQITPEEFKATGRKLLDEKIEQLVVIFDETRKQALNVLERELHVWQEKWQDEKKRSRDLYRAERSSPFQSLGSLYGQRIDAADNQTSLMLLEKKIAEIKSQIEPYSKATQKEKLQYVWRKINHYTRQFIVESNCMTDDEAALFLATRPAPDRPNIEWQNFALKMRFRQVPAGTYSPREVRMGHRVSAEVKKEITISSPFWMSETEVTQPEYVSVMRSNPSKIAITKVQNLDTPEISIINPVENVSWYDAVRFCRALSELDSKSGHKRFYRLPTEAEWRYACQGGDDSPYGDGRQTKHTGDEANIDMRALGYASQGIPNRVAMFPPNNFGLFDMHGSVAEWCSDWFLADYFVNCPTVDPTGPESAYESPVEGGVIPSLPKQLGKVLCGSDSMTKYDSGREGLKRRSDKDTEIQYRGFRVVCELDQPSAITTKQYELLDAYDKKAPSAEYQVALDKHYQELRRRRIVLDSFDQGKSSDESWAKTLEDKIDRYTILSQICVAMAQNRREAKDKEKAAKAYCNAAIYHEAIITERRKAGKDYPAEKEIDDIVAPTLYYIDGNDLARAQEFLTYIKAVNPKHDSISTIEQKLAKAKNSTEK